TKISDILLNEVEEKYYLSDKAWEGMRTRKNQGRGSGYSYRLVEPDQEATQTLLSRYYKSGNEILLFNETRKRGGNNICPTLRVGMGGGGGTIPYIFQFRRNYIRENKENISPTLTSNMGTGGNNVPYVFQ